MIEEIRIENYKSIEKLSLKLGRMNVLIGENGCGKSNILEAFALASAASEKELDHEFLSSRGIRVTKPELMHSGFDKSNQTKPIKLNFLFKSEDYGFEITHDNKEYSALESDIIISDSLYKKHFQRYLKKISNNKIEVEAFKGLSQLPLLKKIVLQLINIPFKNFLIYSPENTSLRTFEKEGQIEPLGIYGEGLFKLLKYFASQKDQSEMTELKSYLKLLGWFEDFSIPKHLFEGESFLQIKDKFLDKNIEYYDQKSANEGFLFILFYFSLLISDFTPKFFAIDNIEASLNPKLCTKVIKSICELAKSKSKQIVVTTHSPSILDGINLNDPEQKIFLVYRNKKGHTVVNEISKPEPLEGQEPIKLSEAFLRGQLGGLPKNFSI